METQFSTIEKLIDYNPETGVLTWKPRPPELYGILQPRSNPATWGAKAGRFNSQYAGKEVYTDPMTGSVRVSTSAYKFERVRDLKIIWWLTTKEMPKYFLIRKNEKGRNTPDNILHVSKTVMAIFQNPEAGVFETPNGYGYRIDIGSRRIKRTGFGSLRSAYNARVNHLKELGMYYLESLEERMAKVGRRHEAISHIQEKSASSATV